MQDTKLLRNVALLGHGGSGKTSLAEALLFTAGKTNRLGKVDDGSSVMDYEPEEIKKHISISSAFNQYDWKKHTVFLTDTPGDDNFITEATIAVRVADGGILVVDAPTGVKYQTTRIVNLIRQRQLPIIIFINKLDKERASFSAAVDAIQGGLDIKTAVIQLPIGEESGFRGVVDLVQRKAFYFDESGNGKVKAADIPPELTDEVEAQRESLMEMVAETDDVLIEKFLEEGSLTNEELQQGLLSATKKGRLCPILAGGATSNQGTELLLNAIVELLPAPDEKPAWTGTDPKTGAPAERKPEADQPFSALVFKTMADPYAGRLTIFRVFSGTLSSDSNFYNSTKKVNERFGQILVLEGKSQKPIDQVGPGMIGAVPKLKETTTGDTLCVENTPILYEGIKPQPPVMSYAVTPARKGDEEKIFSSIGKLLEEDITLKLSRESQTREILLSGVGQGHLEVVLEKIKRKFGVEINTHLPKVPYKETIRGKARVQGRYKKQSGGRGQYGDTWLEIEPLPRGGGFEFQDRIVGGVVPRQFIPAVEKGIVEAMAEGAVAGFPTVDVRVALVDGSYHAVDSSEMAFKIAASMGFKKGILQAEPVLLEPIMNVNIYVPQDCVGDVIGDLNSRRGKVMGMGSESGAEVISAQVPMSEVLSYAPDLTSITGGRGTFTTEFSHYEELPAHLAEKIIAAANAAKEKE